MKAATGEYVISCDSDDWVETDMYEKMYAKAIEEDADIVCCGFRWEYGNGRSAETYEGILRGTKRVGDTSWDMLWPNVWNKLFRRELYVDWNVYPYEGVNKSEDWAVAIRLCYLSKKTVVLYESLYHYNKQNPNAYTSVKQKQSFVKEVIKCTQELDMFFREQGAYEKYNLSIQNLKFRAKLPLLHDGLYQEWLHTFPETHQYIWEFPMTPLLHKVFCRQTQIVEVNILREVPFSRKIVYSLAAHGIFFPYKLRRVVLHLYEIVQRKRPLIGVRM
jgi:glycosyltransferase involved in cell wall biosynthesis